MDSNSDLIKKMVLSNVLKTPEIVEAFEVMDRRSFVKSEYANSAYEDKPLPIGFSQTISQPSTVSFMLELLAPEAGETILDIGSGSGWTTALIAHLVGDKGHVHGVERVRDLVKFGLENLEPFQLTNAHIHTARTHLGLKEYSPYDKILVSAAAEDFPKELGLQLKVGGRIVIPIKNSIFSIEKITPDEIKSTEYYGFSFVPLVHD